ncbi:hypothetical protein [Agrococcus sp. TF02-05]|uniref:hypothetical protein n=1 Tax=Agrococcus sp. TF02-05 TaxID=2815211 RepID=UPI001AA132E5|nr:hypothetical protein [Agrococcus sp. TF02-05]MBO1770463.1 hypothetical protein [Agrococcus sp. TF02-05]
MRSRAIAPRWAGRLDDTAELRLEFLGGARLMGFELVDLDDEEAMRGLAAMKPPRRALQPQQLLIADALNAGYEKVSIEVARRASKTTSIFLWLLGRLAARPGYMATFSAQNGVAGSRRLREWASTLDRINPPDDLHLPPWLRGQQYQPAAVRRHVALFGDELLEEIEPERPTSGRGFKIMRGEVGKGIYFDNGSQLLVLKPDANAYRGEAADVSWIDEAQEIDPLEGDELLAGILPLQDTRPDSMVVVSGTAGEARIGPMWTFLQQLRNGSDAMGGLDWAADPDTPWDLIDDEESAMQLVLDNHPGVGTLTTLDKMRERWREMSRPQWAREYLSMWPETIGEVVIDPDLWDAGKLPAFPARPARLALGFDVKPGGSVAAIAAAWRDRDGHAYVEVVEHRLGTKWLPAELQRLTLKYQTTCAYDPIGDGLATATEAERLRPRPRLRVQLYRETAAGCVQFLRDIERGMLRHTGQQPLQNAIEQASKRETRGDRGVWLWNAATAGADITPLVAATRALRNFDQHYARSTGTEADTEQIVIAVA